ARDVSERNRAREMETRLQKLEFVTFVAHELRTPMTAIATAARLLEDMSELPEDARRVIDVIVRQTGSAERLVRDLLDLSRLESGRFRVELQDVSLAGLVPHLVEANPAPLGKNVEVDIPQGLRVTGDPGRLLQVLSNLLGNAYKYGGSNIWVLATPTGDGARVVVEDDGQGLPHGREADAFEVFARMPGSRGTGAGLGLAIAKGLVEAQNGSIRYEPRDPQGARFVVDLRVPESSAN
ncbi:MAG TPA: HAMP domain-containing sensor histidine kinase, partial [Actinomycetota bacterium]|nr:HAMP domain-containing sensor histidine kinase [Actinomycetota bacterium]